MQEGQNQPGAPQAAAAKESKQLQLLL